MLLKCLLIVVGAVLVGLLLNYFGTKFGNCVECAKKTASTSAWAHLSDAAESSTVTAKATVKPNLVDDILGDDSD